MEELAREIINSINSESSNSASNNLNIWEESENFFGFDEKNYNFLDNYSLNNADSYSVYTSDSKTILTFIDGGQAIISDSPNLCAAVIRIGNISYLGNNRISKSKKEYQILIEKISEGFNIKTFPETEFNNTSIDLSKLYQESIKNNFDSAMIPSDIISIVRRCLELNLASQFKNPVIDGSLELKYDIEKKYLKKVLDNSNVFGLSKTSNMVFEDGETISKKLFREASWYYYPIFKQTFSNAWFDTTFIKLHENSKYLFRLDFNRKLIVSQTETFKELLLVLKNNSKDPIFIGYPYGLIDVDQYVRITEEEREFFRIKLSLKLKDSYNILLSQENSINAHSLLDSIKF